LPRQRVGARRRTGGPSRGTNARSTPLRKRTGSAPLGAPAVRGRSSQRSGTARLLYRWRRQHASMGRNAAMGRGGPHRLQGARTTPEPRHARSLLSSELLELLGARRVASPPPLEGVTRHPPFPARNRTRHPVSRPVSFPIPFRTRHRASRPVSCPVCVLQTPPSLGAIGALGPEPQSGHWERTSRKGPLSSHRGKGIWSPLRDLSSPRAETQSGDLSTRRARLRTG